MEKKVIYREPKNYFSPEMLKAAKDFDKAQKKAEAKKTDAKKTNKK